MLSGDAEDQKVSRIGLPAKDERETDAPERSRSEKEGAVRGSMSQVATFAGSCSGGSSAAG